MSLYPPKKYIQQQPKSELDVLKQSHRFLRTEADDSDTWDASLAKKYEASLFKEFALCDLKHYKSGNVAMRWRTEDEVISGAGELSCANTRCKHHLPPAQLIPTSTANRRWDADDDDPPQKKKHKEKQKPLITLELPFAYTEHEEQKTALVKIVLCERCVKKVNWKREQDKLPDREVAGERKPSEQSQPQPQPAKRPRSVSPPPTNNTRVRYDKDHDIRDQWTS